MRPFLILALGLLLPEYALSCSCADFTLARRFEMAESVFTAVVVDEYVVPADGSARPSDMRVSLLSVTESFKVFPTFSALFSSVNGICDLDLDVGVEYLFFTEAAGGTGTCSGLRPTENSGQELQALRAFSSGATPHVSEPWHVLTREDACVLATNFELAEQSGRVGQLRFLHRKVSDDSPATSELQIYVELTDIRPEAELQPLEIEFADRTYSAPWRTSRSFEQELRDGSRRTRSYADFFKFDGDAMGEILQQVAQAESFRIRFDSELERMDVDAEVETTHLGNGAAEFLSCLGSR